MSVARLMKHDDIEAYAALRREMLLDSPWSFTSTPEEDVASSVESILGWIDESDSEVVLVDDPAIGGLVSAVGVRRERQAKYRHRATIWGVYTRPGSRGKGFGKLAMERAIEITRGWDGVEILQLGVSANAPAARALYVSLGFLEWGLEPACVRIDGVSYDEHHLSLSL